MHKIFLSGHVEANSYIKIYLRFLGFYLQLSNQINTSVGK